MMPFRLTLRPLALAVLGAALACNNTNTEPAAPNGYWSLSSIWSGQVVITDDASAPHWPSDPVTIVSATIKSDTLELIANYGGGCQPQSFVLLSDAAWMESYPVQVGVRLGRDAQGDSCKALLSRMLRFDLSPLKAAYNDAYHTTTGVLRLNISGFSSVLYTW
jgi:hypothetical protein